VKDSSFPAAGHIVFFSNSYEAKYAGPIAATAVSTLGKMRHLFLGVVLLASSVGAIADDGNKLLAGCTSVVRYMDGGSKDLPSDADSIDFSFCLGMMEGVTHTILNAKLLSDRDGGKNYLQTCLPENGISNGQAARIVVRYLRQNPEKLHLPRSMLALFAFKNAYPCN